MRTQILSDHIKVMFDPLREVAYATLLLYPDIQVEVYFDPTLKWRQRGGTLFVGDRAPIIYLNPKMKITQLPEIFAHELAHVVVGPDDDHSDKFWDVLGNIGQKYVEVLKAMQSERKKVWAMRGKWRSG